MSKSLTIIIAIALAATPALAFDPQPDPPVKASSQSIQTKGAAKTKIAEGGRTLADYNIQKE